MSHGLFESRTEASVFRRALCSLAEYFGRDIESDSALGKSILEHSHILNDNGRAVSLAYESEHFRMADLSEYDDLTASGLLKPDICLLDALLELEHYRTCAVYHFESQGCGTFVCLRRFAMGPDEQDLSLGTDHVVEVFIVDGHEALSGESFQFGVIMYDGSK